MKIKQKTFDVWVKRVHTFTATIKADSFEQALGIARNNGIDFLIDAPGETIDSEHELTAVMKNS